MSAATALKHRPEPAPQVCVIVHLTSFAPGCESLGIGDRRRNRHFWNKPLLGVVKATLKRLQRGPRDVQAVEFPPADNDADSPVEIIADEVHLVADVAPYGSVPLAAFWDGATAPELRHALRLLAEQGWRPDQSSIED